MEVVQAARGQSKEMWGTSTPEESKMENCQKLEGFLEQNNEDTHRLPKVIIKSQNFENFPPFSVPVNKKQLFPISKTIKPRLTQTSYVTDTFV